MHTKTRIAKTNSRCDDFIYITHCRNKSDFSFANRTFAFVFVLLPGAGNGDKSWCFSQIKGALDDDVTDADIISCVEFNHDGELLATGDKGGRVVIFQVSVRHNCKMLTIPYDPNRH